MGKHSFTNSRHVVTNLLETEIARSLMLEDVCKDYKYSCLLANRIAERYIRGMRYDTSLDLYSVKDD